MTPPTAADDWPGRAAIKDRKRWIAPGGGSSFGPDIHVELLRGARLCADELAAAQWRQELGRRLYPEQHFDNCAFAQGLRYLEQQLAVVDGLIHDPGASQGQVTQASSALGRAIDLIQDFYAHSNYLELMAQRDVPFGEALVVPIWLPEGQKSVQDLVGRGLQSGRYRSSGPPGCGSTYAEMDHDSEDLPKGQSLLPRFSRNGYRAAYGLADLATRQFLRYAFARWPALNKGCEGVMEYLPLGARRSP